MPNRANEDAFHWQNGANSNPPVGRLSAPAFAIRTLVLYTCLKRVFEPLELDAIAVGSSL
jgi:hypothetical protein